MQNVNITDNKEIFWWRRLTIQSIYFISLMSQLHPYILPKKVIILKVAHTILSDFN